MVAVAQSPARPPLATNITLLRRVKTVKTLRTQIESLTKEKLKGTPDCLTHVFMLLDYLPDQCTPAALTLQADHVCMIIDLTQLPLEHFTEFFSLFRGPSSMRLITPNAASAAAVYGAVYGRQTSGSIKLFDDGSKPLILDVQLGYELFNGAPGVSLDEIAGTLRAKYTTQGISLPVPSSPKGALTPFAERARCFRHVYEQLSAALGTKNTSRWLKMSQSRTRRCLVRGSMNPCDATTPIGFEQDTFRVMSLDLLDEGKSSAVDTAISCEGEKEELQKLFNLLPEAWASKLVEQVDRKLIDVEVDVGRPPFAHFKEGQKLILSNGREEYVEQEHVDRIKRGLEELGEGIGYDNRAGINGTLHRISVIPSTVSPGSITGATLRAGRHILGVATILYDVLFHRDYESDSILLLGPPCSGKTTMIRDIARLLSAEERVIIVDSSAEIGGPAAVAHRSIGDARRMPVPGGKHNLAKTLIEAVENHTPDVIIADELSNHQEVSGASTAKNRGVRVVSSAHGCLRKLLRNGVLRGLTGGFEQVIMSDRNIPRGDTKGKLRPVRSGEPVFKVIVEMGVVEDDTSACRIVRDAGAAVDAILDRRAYACELRRRDKDENIVTSRIFA